jgi:pyruvate/2-oxoglutarate/acetoin dehydrogenase E1 component
MSTFVEAGTHYQSNLLKPHGVRNTSYKAALAEACAIEMRRDPSVVLYGLDVTDHKRIFGTTEGLLEEFGSSRVFHTPLSEDAMTGAGMGMALNGLRPIHIHIRADFLLLGMNQIANMLSSYRYMSGGNFKVPMVIRAVIGRGWGQGAQHSKSMQSVFAHFPGIKVIMPTTPADAKGLLASAIRDDNPVISLEHRWLFEAVDHVPEGEYTVPIGEPAVMREGSDITLVTSSWMTVEALEAARILHERAGVSCEVVDVRTVAPLNMDPIFKSAAKTKRAIVADNDWVYCGFGSELAASIMENCWDSLTMPVKRIGFAPSPCPATRPLENHFYPNAAQIIAQVTKSLDIAPIDLSSDEFYSWTKRFKGPF